MVFKGKNSHFVELKVLNNKNGLANFSDTDWLKMHFNVQSKFGNWQVTDESLMLFEFKELINWFKDLAQNKLPKHPELFFTEPNLEFRLVSFADDLKKIKLVFSAELWQSVVPSDEDEYLEFRFSNHDLSKIASELEGELQGSL
jgi:hypothetical protein